MKHRNRKLFSAIIAALALTCGSNFLTAADWDVNPEVKRSVSPENPNKAKGLVTAVIEIDSNGHVVGAKIDKSTDASLEPHVLEAVQKWAFTPAKKDGEAVACTIKVPFKFGS